VHRISQWLTWDAERWRFSSIRSECGESSPTRKLSGYVDILSLGRQCTASRPSVRRPVILSGASRRFFLSRESCLFDFRAGRAVEVRFSIARCLSDESLFAFANAKDVNKAKLSRRCSPRRRVRVQMCKLHNASPRPRGYSSTLKSVRSRILFVFAMRPPRKTRRYRLTSIMHFSLGGRSFSSDIRHRK